MAFWRARADLITSMSQVFLPPTLSYKLSPCCRELLAEVLIFLGDTNASFPVIPVLSLLVKCFIVCDALQPV